LRKTHACGERSYNGESVRWYVIPRGTLTVQRPSPDERRMQFIEPPAETDQFRTDVLRGLRRPAKELPCKYFYDETGSRLFEQICELEEYYLTRTELAIMRKHASEMAELLGLDCLLVEYGSGSSVKTRLLL